MTKVKTLVAQLKGAMPLKIKTRIEKLEALEVSHEELKNKYATEPSDDLQAEIEEVNGMMVELSDSIAEQLEELIVAENQPPSPPTPAPAPPAPSATPPLEIKEKSKTNWLLAGVLGITAIAGGIFLFNKNK